MADKNVNWDGWVTPDLARNPGAAIDVLNSGNPNSTNAPVSHALKGTAVQDAINDNATTNDNLDFWHKILNGTVDKLEWLGKPLKEIQRDYKFIHSVYTDVGLVQGFLATAGIVGGAVAGGFLGGPAGVAAGADAIAFAERKLLGNVWKESYAKSENENYKVSPGRDFSNLLSKAAGAVTWDSAEKALKDTNHGWGKTISGTADLGFDIEADPLMVIARFGQLMKSGKYLGIKEAQIQVKYPILRAGEGVKNFLIERSGAPLTSAQMDAVRSASGFLNPVSRQYNAALEDMANISKNAVAKDGISAEAIAAGEIAARYPALGTIVPARIGAMKSADEIHSFFKTSVYFGELRGTLAGHAMLPSRTLLRAKAADWKVTDVLRNAMKPKYISDPLDSSKTILNPEWKKYGVARNISKVYNTFTGYMPYSVDPTTLELSRKSFKWNANDAVNVIYRIARIGMGDAGAKEMAGQYAQAVAMEGESGLGLARSIKNHTIVEALKALGMPDAESFVKASYDAAHNVDIPVISRGIYGVTNLVEPLGDHITSQGLKNSGLFDRHAEDMFTIPDFLDIKKAMRDAGTVMKVVGKLDEWTSAHYINKIFKPLALGTAGFGLRVSAAELLPTFARYGILNTFKARVAVSVAKSGIKLAKKEEEHITAAALTALGAADGVAENALEVGFPAFLKAQKFGLKFASKLTPQEQIDLAIDIIRDREGQFLPDATRAGHGTGSNQAWESGMTANYVEQIYSKSKLFKSKTKSFNTRPGFTTYSTNDIHFTPRYVTELAKASKDAAQKNIARDILDNWQSTIKGAKAQIESVEGSESAHEAYNQLRKILTDKETARMQAAVNGKYKPYDYEKQTLSRWTDASRDGTLRAFAQDRVDATLGLLVGQDGTLLEAFTQNVANGLKTDFGIVKGIQETNPRMLPGGVAGPNLEAYHPGKDVSNWLVNITNLGFKKIIDPIVNGLSREPMYMLHVGDAYARIKPLIESKYYTEEQARRLAQTEAVYTMLPEIHNVALRSQFAQLARNFLPFYFAQEQALKRAFKTLKDTSIVNPIFSRGMRFFQISEHALSTPGFTETDDSGNQFLYLPGVGGFGEAVQATLDKLGMPMVTGLPVTGKGSLISLKSVLPELNTPGVSPFLAISGNIIADWFPELEGPIKGAIGDISYQRDVMDTLIPSAWFKTAMASLGGPDFTNQLNNATASALASAYYHGQVPDANNTDIERQNFVELIKNNAKSILMIKAFLGFFSPLAPQISQEDAGFRSEFWKLVKQKGNMADAWVEFSGKHGSRAVSYTVARTESTLHGFHAPYVRETVDFIDNNKDLFDPRSGVASAAYYLIPQDNATNVSDRAVFNELVQRHLRTVRSPEELLKQFYIAQGQAVMDDKIAAHVAKLKEYQYVPELKKLENDKWSQTIQTMAVLYPIWYTDYKTGGTDNAKQIVGQLNKLFDAGNPNQPNNEQSVLVKNLLMEYNQYAAQKASYSGLGIAPIVTQSIEQNWKDRLATLSVDEPRLKTIINSVFMKLG